MGHILISLTILAILTGIFFGCSASRKPGFERLISYIASGGISQSGTKQRVYSHLSLTKKQCTQCHMPAKFGSLNPYDGESPVQADRADGQVTASRLIVPPDRLCFKCHGYGTAEDGFPEGLWQHAPSAQGACIFCHNPHFSENRFMLRSQSSIICSSQCHIEDYVLEIEAHREFRECLDCHNAHIGTNPHMLKKEYHEDWVPPKKSWIESRPNSVE